ncbi:hypothetical protein V8E53_009183 [Lactarius tabidus]
MIRCMANKYSALGLWSTWNCSCNLGITHNFYSILLGGTWRPADTSVLAFTFVPPLA